MRSQRFTNGFNVIGVVILTALVANPPSASPQALKRFGKAHELATHLRGDNNVALHQWCAGQVYGVDLNASSTPLLYKTDKDGRVDHIPFSIVGASIINLRALTCTPNSTIAVSGSAYADDGKVGYFISRISVDGKPQLLLRTSPYVAVVLAIAADETLWTAGWVKSEDGRKIARHNVFRRMDQTGRLLNEFALSARASAGVGRDAVNLSHLRASRDRVGWLSNSAEYFEFALDGRQLYHGNGPPLPESGATYYLSYTLSVDNYAVVGVATNQGWSVWSLDREKHEWNRLQFTQQIAPAWGSVLGLEDGALVIRESQGTIRAYFGVDN